MGLFGGAKRCLQCEGGGWLKGNGKCNECFGSGVNTHLDSSEPKCEKCKGTGICPICKGSGKVPSV